MADFSSFFYLTKMYFPFAASVILFHFRRADFSIAEYISIRAMDTGNLSMLAVRWASLQRRVYSRSVPTKLPFFVCDVCHILLFFPCLSIQFDHASSFSGRSRLSRKLSKISSKDHLENTNLSNFLVLHLLPIAAVDMSSTEAFVWIHRLLDVTLVFCGFTADSPIGKTLAWSGTLGRSMMPWDVSSCCGLIGITTNKFLVVFRDGKHLQRLSIIK